MTSERQARWLATHGQTIDVDEYEDDLVAIIEQIAAAENLTPDDITRLLYRVSRGNEPLTKDQLVKGYRALAARGVVSPSRKTLARLRTKPVRTISGVAPVTVMTKPFPCPGECIFCPDFAGMPKSYIPDEPGRSVQDSSSSTPTRRPPSASARWKTSATAQTRSSCSSSAGHGRTIRPTIKSGSSAAAWMQ